jgi:hypothetical protein
MGQASSLPTHYMMTADLLLSLFFNPEDGATCFSETLLDCQQTTTHYNLQDSSHPYLVTWGGEYQPKRNIIVILVTKHGV